MLPLFNIPECEHLDRYAYNKLSIPKQMDYVTCLTPWNTTCTINKCALSLAHCDNTFSLNCLAYTNQCGSNRFMKLKIAFVHTTPMHGCLRCL